jgi:hypothetical protein
VVATAIKKHAEALSNFMFSSEGDWYGYTATDVPRSDSERVEMGAELLEIFGKLGYDVSGWTENSLAQQMNNIYDWLKTPWSEHSLGSTADSVIDTSDQKTPLSVWRVACLALNVNPAMYEEIFIAQNDREGGEEEQDEAYNSGLSALEDLTGYYHRVGTAGGISLVDYFSLDGYASTWAALDKAGFEVKDSDGKIVAGSLRMEDGILLLDFPWTGSVIRFQVLDNGGVTQLREEESGDVFEYGDEPGDPELDLAALEGKWYLDGNTSKYYYEITSNTYKYCSSSGNEITSGRCSISAATSGYSVGDAVSVMTVTFGDSMFSDKGYFLPDYKTFHMNGLGDGKIYVHETIIGTDEYNTAITLHWFIYGNWKPADGSCAISMFPNGSFEYSTRVDEGDGWHSFKEADSGQWELSGSELTIVWSDGTKDVCDFAGNAFHVPSKNITFLNGKAAGGV